MYRHDSVVIWIWGTSQVWGAKQSVFGLRNSMTLCLYARWRFRLSSLLDKEVIAPCGTSVPCQLRPAVRRHGRGVL